MNDLDSRTQLRFELLKLAVIHGFISPGSGVNSMSTLDIMEAAVRGKPLVTTFAEEHRMDGQVVRLEAPTRAELDRLVKERATAKG